MVVELIWVLERSYGYSRDRIALILEELTASGDLVVEVPDEVTWAAFLYRRGEAGFSDLMIMAAGKRAGARSRGLSEVFLHRSFCVYSMKAIINSKIT